MIKLNALKTEKCFSSSSLFKYPQTLVLSARCTFSKKKKKTLCHTLSIAASILDCNSKMVLIRFVAASAAAAEVALVTDFVCNAEHSPHQPITLRFGYFFGLADFVFSLELSVMEKIRTQRNYKIDTTNSIVMCSD